MTIAATRYIGATTAADVVVPVTALVLSPPLRLTYTNILPPFAAPPTGGGGGPVVPTTGQIWPRASS